MSIRPSALDRILRLSSLRDRVTCTERAAEIYNLLLSLQKLILFTVAVLQLEPMKGHFKTNFNITKHTTCIFKIKYIVCTYGKN